MLFVFLMIYATATDIAVQGFHRGVLPSLSCSIRHCYPKVPKISLFMSSAEVQMDMFGDPDNMEALDDTTLEALRRERKIANQRWQSLLFKDNQSGQWTGSFEVMMPSISLEGISLAFSGEGTVTSRIACGEVTNDGVVVQVQEQYLFQNQEQQKQSELAVRQLGLTTPTRTAYQPEDFSSTYGNQAVGNTYTLSALDSIGGTQVVELGVREGPLRTRVRFGYHSSRSSSLTEQELASGEFSYCLSGICVIRESLSQCSPSEILPLLDQSLGVGVYDPQASGEPYVLLNLPGRLSILFPRGLRGDQTVIPPALEGGGKKDVITMEWQCPRFRYQVDRRFVKCDGSITSIELTEIRPEDAEIYPPGHNDIEILR